MQTYDISDQCGCQSSEGSAQLQVLLDEWMQCSGQWQKSTLFERMTAKKSCRKHGARVWLTRGQIATKYGDQKVADEICDAKLLDPAIKETHTKSHPDAPNSEARSNRLFGVSPDLPFTNTKTNINRSILILFYHVHEIKMELLNK